MAEIITMPKLGFDMAEGSLVRWVIQEGENVKKGDILAEIETDKATVEVESQFEGVLYRHLVTPGEVVPVNTPIAVVSQPGEQVNLEALLGEPEKPAAVAAEKVEAEKSAETPPPAAEAPAKAGEAEHLPDGVRASPLARRMAREMKINLAQVSGSGTGGRITKKDILAFVEAPAAAEAPEVEAPPAAVEAAKPAAIPLSPLGAYEGGEPQESVEIPLNRLRAAIGRRMTQVKQQVPHFYVTYEYDVSDLLALRKEVNPLLPEGEKLSVNDFILKAVALALRQFPNLNASLEGETVIHHGQVNVGVAVAVEGGLLTVVCRDTDRKSLRQISLEVRTMATRARAGKVRPNDIEGSTFSVSNLGMFNVEHFIAIINPPEAAILAVGAARQVPVVVGEEIKPRWRMKATLSVDHRVSDGAEAAQFLQFLQGYIENPIRLLL